MNGKPIQVFVSDGCQECNQLVTFLEEYNVPFHLINTSENRDNLEKLQENGLYLTPAVIVSKHCRLLGFQRNKLKEVLGL
ncbi:glutaredoxin domain-containing protein [Gracilibacillus sp. YIM 98692]|uniref:glutaredoxin family protein n=1 Tax=Gracilibacillus sp. YIM 98692 TaxID=2663532 RepID=UPI0013D77D67|nr:glutaredoxin domain-containing protein [Gracilibacillus sp. YIM 98692]